MSEKEWNPIRSPKPTKLINPLRKKKPTGFVAICQCGENIGAMDYRRTKIADAGKILSEWIMDGCIIEPRFDNMWSVQIGQCKCDET